MLRQSSPILVSAQKYKSVDTCIQSNEMCVPTKFTGMDTCPDGYTLIETKLSSTYPKFPLDANVYPKVLVCAKVDGTQDDWTCPIGYTATRTGPCCKARTPGCMECARNSTWFCIPQEGPRSKSNHKFIDEVHVLLIRPVILHKIWGTRQNPFQ